MASNVQDQIAADEGQSFDRPINVSVIEKLKKFPFVQELGFAGQLPYAKETFHGLSDWNRQMTTYSGTSMYLLAPWAAVKLIAMANAEVAKNLFSSKTLGNVGSAFKKLVGFDQVFAVSPDELTTGGSNAITKKLPI